MANQEQLSILNQGLLFWNQWREEKSQVKIDLKEVDLRGTNLIGANLNGADLRRAKLNGADLRGAQLNKANLRGANLNGADLVGAKLNEANLIGASLNGTDLRGVDLIGAKLHNASLRGANLNGADLRRAYLNKADLSGAKFDGVDFRDADFTGAILYGDQLYEALRRDVPQSMPSDDIPSWLEALPASAEDIARYFPLVKSSQSPLVKSSQSDDVSFTAIYPRENKVEMWHTLLVYAHFTSALQDVRQDAQRFRDQIPIPKEITSSSTSQIARGTEITIIPTCDGLVFNPDRMVVKWIENYHRADFRFLADKSLSNDAARGQINFYVGPIMIGTLKFAMLFNETEAQTIREDEVHGIMYRQEDIFVSYSHKDSAVVLACKKAYQALGFNVLIDIETLRSGQLWNEELAHMIDNATIFQLFWSENSKKSKYCKQEWKHALKRNTEGFIRPMYWQKPIAKPPRELSKYHFEYVEF